VGQEKAVELKHGLGRLEVSSFGGDDVRISIAVKDRTDETTFGGDECIVITREDVPAVIQALTQIALEAETMERREAQRTLYDSVERRASRRKHVKA
jgi:hypothetical protein